MATGNFGDTFTTSMNRLAGTRPNGINTLAAQGAANVWAGTTGLALLGALNAKNSSFGMGLGAVMNALAGTTGLTPTDAAWRIDA